MNDLDMAWFRKHSKEAWEKHLSPKTWPAAQTIFECFKTEMLLDPFELLLQSRRSQDNDAIMKALDRFYLCCLYNRGLSRASAKQYRALMKTFFKANRVRLPSERKRAPLRAVPQET